jgi:rhodanese-related sulfurtransferase
MKKILLVLLLLCTYISAEVINAYPDQKLFDSGITIIDIRTEGEWKETGLIKDAVPITFWYADGSYNIRTFMQKLQKHVKKGEKFALVCHVGNRTAEVSAFLSKTFDMKVVNLLGGMEYLKKKGYKTVPYHAKP